MHDFSLIVFTSPLLNFWCHMFIFDHLMHFMPLIYIYIFKQDKIVTNTAETVHLSNEQSFGWCFMNRPSQTW